MHLAAFASVVVLLESSLAAAQLSAAPIVEKIAPGAVNCPGGDDECRTAAQAAPWIAKGMMQYGVYSVNEIAAVISVMAYESDDFKYKHNVYPGRPGQGTANMQMANYNLMYAKQIDDVKAKVAQFTTTDGLSDDDLNKILSFVTPDQYNFGSGPWFLTTQCPSDVRQSLQADIDDGWTAYLGCIGVSATPDRTAYLTRAKSAFGIK